MPHSRIKTLLQTACLLALMGLLPACGKGVATDHSTAQLEKARRLIEQGNYQEAFMHLNQALAEAPRDPQVHLNLGWLYLYTDDPLQANRELSQLRELAPDLGETYHLTGALLSYDAQKTKKSDPAAAQKGFDAAVNSFREALKRDPKNDETYFDLATGLIALERYEEALEVLNQGFEHIPAQDLENQVNFQVASCTAHAKLGLYEEAIADCNQAKEFTHNPDSRLRIEEMIENMKLLTPSKDAAKKAQAEEDAIIDAAVSD